MESFFGVPVAEGTYLRVDPTKKCSVHLLNAVVVLSSIWRPERGLDLAREAPGQLVNVVAKRYDRYARSLASSLC